MHFPCKRSAFSAFTVVELTVVITIILILLGLLSPAINRARQRARIEQAKAMIGSLEVAINMYYADNGSYPAEDSWESLLVNKTGNYGPYMDKKNYDGTNFTDLWGNAYNYDIDEPNNTERFDLWSNGLDGEDDAGGDDDITNW